MTKIWSKLSKPYAERIPTAVHILLPNVAGALDNVDGKSLLDVGCGYGLFSSFFGQRGARVLGIDSSKEMVDLAKKVSPKACYKVMDVKEVSQLNQKFDYVLAVMVFCTLNNRQDFCNAFREISCVMKPKGRFVLVDEHPSSKKNLKTAVLEKQFPENSYFNSGQSYRVLLRSEKGSEVSFDNYQWTLEDYANTIRNFNLEIIGIKEPRPSPKICQEHPELTYFLENPGYILFDIQKKEEDNCLFN